MRRFRRFRYVSHVGGLARVSRMAVAHMPARSISPERGAQGRSAFMQYWNSCSFRAILCGTYPRPACSSAEEATAEMFNDAGTSANSGSVDEIFRLLQEICLCGMLACERRDLPRTALVFLGQVCWYQPDERIGTDFTQASR